MINIFKCAWQTSVDPFDRKHHAYSLWGSFHVVGMGEEQGGDFSGVTFRGQLVSLSWCQWSILTFCGITMVYSLKMCLLGSSLPCYIRCVIMVFYHVVIGKLVFAHHSSLKYLPDAPCEMLVDAALCLQTKIMLLLCDVLEYISIFQINHVSGKLLTWTGSSFSWTGFSPNPVQSLLHHLLSWFFFVFSKTPFPPFSDPVSNFDAQLFHSHCFSLHLSESHVGFSVNSDAPVAAYASFLAFAKTSRPPCCRPLTPPFLPLLCFLCHLLFCATVISCALGLITWC